MLSFVLSMLFMVHVYGASLTKDKHEQTAVQCIWCDDAQFRVQYEISTNCFDGILPIGAIVTGYLYGMYVCSCGGILFFFVCAFYLR